MNVFGAAPAEEAGEGVRLGGFRFAWRQKFLLATAALCVAAATHGLLATLPPNVEVRARVAIERTSPVESVIDSDFLAGQAKLIASRDALRRAATELGVTDAGVLTRPTLLQRVLAVVGLGGAGKLVSPEERLTEALAAGFSAAPAGHGRSIDVRFSAENAEVAVRFVDRVVGDYLALQGTNGGVGARLVSGAVAEERTAILPPFAGAALAGLLVLALGGAAAGVGRWRCRDSAELPEDAPLAVGTLEPLGQPAADDEVREEPPGAGLPVVATVPPAAAPSVDVAEHRRVAVASFGEGGENRRLIDELVRDGGANGARIVIVDVSRRAGDRPGLAELLAGDADFASVIQRNVTLRTHEIGPGARPLATLAEDTEAAAILLESLEQTYDLVLIDLGRLRADPTFTLFARLAGQLMLTGDAEAGAVDTLLAALGRRGVTGIVRVASPTGEMAA